MKNTIVPTLIFPYAVCLGAICMSSSYIFRMFFSGNAINMLIPILMLWIISAICNCFYLYRAKTSRRRSRGVLKELVIIKTLQIPAYIVIACVAFFRFGDLWHIMEFVIMAYMALTLTSSVSIYTIYRCYRHNRIRAGECIAGIACQFVFFVDAICLNSIYMKVKRRKKHRREA